MDARKRKAKLAGELCRFAQQYARKAHKGWDPNDRSYDRKVEQKMKQLEPDVLSDLLRGDDVEPLEPHRKA